MSNRSTNSLGSDVSVYDSPIPDYGDLAARGLLRDSDDNLALPVPEGRNWNEEFQTLLDLSFENEDEEMRRMSQLRQLSHEFATRATEIGQVIITEKALSYDEKTIKTHTQLVGGYAGGEKYLVDGIFFKFAVDNHGLYGDDEHAMKCGVHEFKNFMELADCRVHGLHFPLIVIIDYRGFRLLCQSVLPIGSNTLVYGSKDGGKNIYAADPQMNKRMKRIAKLLNLAGHDVSNTSKTTTVRLHGPVDCEGHLGVDGRFYIIDPARLFPPAKPNPAVKGGKLFMLLRPELVMKSRYPLCSDSFSNFNVHDRASFDTQTEQIDAYLHNELIPEFTQYLCHEYHNKYSLDATFTNDAEKDAGAAQTSTHSGRFWAAASGTALYNVLTTQHLEMADLERIINEAHRKGINLRYFGEVRALVPSTSPLNQSEPAPESPRNVPVASSSATETTLPQYRRHPTPHRRSTSQDEEIKAAPAPGSPGLDLLRSVLLTIIVGRVLKNLIRSHLRTIHTPDERPYRKLLLTYLNLLFGRTPKANEFWSRPLKASIGAAFPHALAPHELLPSFNLRQSILPYTLYLYLQELLGLEMRLESKAKFTNIDPSAPPPSTSLEMSKASTSASPSTRTMTSSNPPGALFFLPNSMPSQFLLFRPLLDSDLINIVPKVRYTNRMSFEEATALSRKAKFAGSQEASDRYFHLAEKNYRSALRIKPDDYRALHNWGLSLALQAQTKTGPEASKLFDLAQSKWLQALEINPQDYRAHLLWGNMLLERAEGILSAFPHHMDGGVKNKHLAAREAEKLSLLVAACDKYQQAYDLNEDNYEILYNWATALLLRGTLDSPNALELLQEAANKYQGATAIKPNSLKAHLNWAVAIAKCARSTFDKALPVGDVAPKRRSVEIVRGRLVDSTRALDASSSSISSTSSVSSTSSIPTASPSPSSPRGTTGFSLQPTSSAPTTPQPSTSSKYFKKAEKLFAIASEKFEECLELRSDDCEVYFNYGNALYRRARMHERCKRYLSAMDLCSLCCERYISAINIKLNYYDALYNWGSVVHFLSTIPNLETKESEVLFIVNCYLEVFKKVALRYGGTERFKLDPVLSLLHSRREPIQRRAVHVINSLSNDGKDAIQREAYRAIKSLLANPITRRMMNEELDEGDWSKYSSQLVRTIGSANKINDDEDELGKVTLDSFSIGAVIDGGDAGVGKMLRCVRKATQQPHIVISVAHNDLLDRLGILESEGALNMAQQHATALHKTYINHLKVERPYLAQLQYSFQTEEDDICLLYRYTYNPGMLWEFLSNPSLPPKAREQNIRFYAAEILIALQSLHQRDMMYGDLNPLELLVDGQGHILLHKIPFSQQADIKPSDLSPEYVSPEILTSQQPYKSSTDWYCFGVLLYQLATCMVQSFNVSHETSNTASSSTTSLAKSSLTPHGPSGRHSRVSSSDKSGENRMAYIPALSWVDDGHEVNFGPASPLSPELRDLISLLLHLDLKSRLKSAAKIQKHPFWGNINWKLLETAGLDPPYRPGLGPSSGLTNSFTAVPTLLAKLKRGKFHGYSFVEP